MLPVLAGLALIAQAPSPPPASTVPPSAASVLRDLGLETRPPPTAADIAAAYAQADAIAAAAQAADLFENVTSGAEPALRHRASGYTCVFTPGSRINQILLFHPPRGDSVGCNTSRGKVSVSIFLDRAPAARPPVETLMPALAHAIVQRFPGAQPFGPIVTTSGRDAAGGDLPPHHVAQFKRSTPQGETEERLAVGYAGDWLLQQRVTEPAADSTVSDLFNELSFLRAQREIISHAAGGAS